MLSERIKILRKELKLTQKEFGEALGTSRDVISNLEYGRSEPKEAFLGLICAIFNVNNDWLKKGNGDMFCPIPDSNNDMEEDLRIFEKLTPRNRRYAIQTIRAVLEAQNNEENE